MTNRSDETVNLSSGKGAPGELLVMGARGNHGGHGAFYTRSWRLVALDASTLTPKEATWQYEGEQHKISGTTFFDTRPFSRLIVRAGDQHITLNPSNITATAFAMSALRNDGSIRAWGDSKPPQSVRDLTDVVELSSGMYSFAVRRAKGNVLAWGPSNRESSHVPDNIAQQKNIESISGSSYVFAALQSPGKVLAWGSEAEGGVVPQPIAELSDIVQLRGGQTGFAALRRNGQVVAWGKHAPLPDDIASLTDIKQLACSTHATAVLRANRQVRAWGIDALGGRPDSRHYWIDRHC
jgi:hypothetical protein